VLAVNCGIFKLDCTDLPHEYERETPKTLPGGPEENIQTPKTLPGGPEKKRQTPITGTLIFKGVSAAHCASNMLGGIIHDKARSSILIFNSTFNNISADIGALLYSDSAEFPNLNISEIKTQNISDSCGKKGLASLPVKILPSPIDPLPLSLLTNFSIQVLLLDNFGGVVCSNYDPSATIEATIFPVLPNGTKNYGNSTSRGRNFDKGVFTLDIHVVPRLPGVLYKGIVTWGALDAEISFRTADYCPDRYVMDVCPPLPSPLILPSRFLHFSSLSLLLPSLLPPPSSLPPSLLPPPSSLVPPPSSLVPRPSSLLLPPSSLTPHR
jgi:hypothetical protein